MRSFLLDSHPSFIQALKRFDFRAEFDDSLPNRTSQLIRGSYSISEVLKTPNCFREDCLRN